MANLVDAFGRSARSPLGNSPPHGRTPSREVHGNSDSDDEEDDDDNGLDAEERALQELKAQADAQREKDKP